MKEINLIDFQKKKLFGLYRHVKLFRFVVIIFNLGLILTMLIFFGLFLSSSKRFKDNELKISNLKTEIGKQAKKESYLVTIDNRLKKIDDIFKARVSQTDFLARIKELFVEGYSFSFLEIKSQKTLRISGTCADKQCLSLIYSKAEELKERKVFSEFVFDEVSRNLDRPFEVGISLKYK